MFPISLVHSTGSAKRPEPVCIDNFSRDDLTEGFNALVIGVKMV